MDSLCGTETLHDFTIILNDILCPYTELLQGGEDLTVHGHVSTEDSGSVLPCQFFRSSSTGEDAGLQEDHGLGDALKIRNTMLLGNGLSQHLAHQDHAGSLVSGAGHQVEVIPLYRIIAVDTLDQVVAAIVIHIQDTQLLCLFHNSIQLDSCLAFTANLTGNGVGGTGIGGLECNRGIILPRDSLLVDLTHDAFCFRGHGVQHGCNALGNGVGSGHGRIQLCFILSLPGPQLGELVHLKGSGDLIATDGIGIHRGEDLQGLAIEAELKCFLQRLSDLRTGTTGGLQSSGIHSCNKRGLQLTIKLGTALGSKGTDNRLGSSGVGMAIVIQLVKHSLDGYIDHGRHILRGELVKECSGGNRNVLSNQRDNLMIDFHTVLRNLDPSSTVIEEVLHQAFTEISSVDSSSSLISLTLQPVVSRIINGGNVHIGVAILCGTEGFKALNLGAEAIVDVREALQHIAKVTQFICKKLSRSKEVGLQAAGFAQGELAASIVNTSLLHIFVCSHPSSTLGISHIALKQGLGSGINGISGRC